MRMPRMHGRPPRLPGSIVIRDRHWSFMGCSVQSAYATPAPFYHAISRPPLCIPTVLLAHLDHRGQDVVPRLLLHHHVVGEHAAVPADVLDGAGRAAGFVFEPVAGDFGDVEFA